MLKQWNKKIELNEGGYESIMLAPEEVDEKPKLRSKVA